MVNKEVLRGFELALGLCVNFNKSKVLRFNVSQDFLQDASDFLLCSISQFPFTLLGIPIGANPHRCSTWELILQKICNKFYAWKGKHVSLGIRVILINLVLNVLPLLFLSFCKARK